MKPLMSAVALQLLAVFAPSDGLAAPFPPQQVQVQPLDPLTEQERALAEKLARGDQRAQTLLAGAATRVSIELLAMKGQGDDPVRHADILFARADSEFGARAIVRLGTDPAVVEFTRVDTRSLPVTQAEVDAAWRVALADAGYQQRLQRDSTGLKPEALRLYTEDRKDPCFAGRCLYLIVRDGDFYVSRASVVVDLAQKRVLAERSPK